MGDVSRRLRQTSTAEGNSFTFDALIRATRSTSVVTTIITLLIVVAVVGGFAAVPIHRSYLREAYNREAAETNSRRDSQVVAALLSRASHESDQKELERAEGVARDSTNSYEKLLSRSDSAELRYRAALAYHTVARVSGLIGNREKAISACRRGIELLNTLIEAHPKESNYLDARGACYLTLGGQMWDFGSLSAEEPYYQAAADYQLLVDRFSNQPPYQAGLAEALAGMATLSWSKGQLEVAQGYFAQVDQLLSNVPDTGRGSSWDPYVVISKDTVLLNEALLAKDYGDAKQAHALIEQVVNHRRVFGGMPTDRQTTEFVFKNYANLGAACIKAGQPAAAASTAEMLIAIFPERLDAYREAATVFIEGARLADQAAAAEAAEFKARAGQNRDFDSDMAPNYDARITAQNYMLRAEELIAKARHVDDHNPDSVIDFALFLLLCKHEPFRDFQRALELAQDVVKGYPKCGRAWFALALSKYRCGEWQAATEAAENSMKLTNSEKSDKSNVYNWLLLSMIRFQQGQFTEAQQWKTKADNWLAGNTLKDGVRVSLAMEAQALEQNRHDQRP